MVAGVGDIGAHLADEVLELGLVLLDRRVLSKGNSGQSREDGGEAHDDERDGLL